ncbi:MAG: response regulator transcription factor [Phycisphaerales bacterium]|nr:response regulator transcription factor [Phycisphaerales bacterium]
MATTHILIIEDEPEIAELIALNLDTAGMRAEAAASGEAGLSAMETTMPDLVVLDLMLPGIDGLEVCRRLKYEAATRSLPIIMLTARGEEADIVAGLEMGADDYMVKPFSPRELVARIRAVLRRDEPAPHEDARSRKAEGIRIDADRHEVLVDGVAVELTLTEFQILRYLAQRPGFVRTRDQIIEAAHGPHVIMSGRTIDVHITALRKKLAHRGGSIETVRGVGYRIDTSVLLA